MTAYKTSNCNGSSGTTTVQASDATGYINAAGTSPYGGASGLGRNGDLCGGDVHVSLDRRCRNALPRCQHGNELNDCLLFGSGKFQYRAGVGK